MTGAWRDVRALLPRRPGALAAFAEVLGSAGVSLEGGGAVTHADAVEVHFLVRAGDLARAALEAAGPDVARDVVLSEVVTLRLAQDVPGQLGTALRRMTDAGVEVLAQYSDHDGRLVLVVDDVPAARVVAERWDAAG